MLNDRERLINCLTFKKVDRPPFLFIFGPWPETLERWQQEAEIELELNNYFDIKYLFR